MATRKTPLVVSLNPKQQIALQISAAFYAGPAGHALLDKADGETMEMVVQRALEFTDIFLQKTADQAA